jgi:3-hydroxybutyryl-CoA dehydrogenase
MTEIRTIGVIGAGQMGSGIAQVCAQSGFEVFLYDQSAPAVAKALEKINRGIVKSAEKGLISTDAANKAKTLLKSASEVKDLSQCDLVIEAATENEEIKKAIFKSVCEFLKPDAILASNTSSISITRLATSTDRPAQFIGLHFMNPVPIMKLVEIIRGIATDSETYERSLQFCEALGKITANAQDYPAFIVNRILIPMINEAIYTLYEGVGTVEAIDTAMKLGANHPMGPLELADFIGLDTVLAIMNVLYDGLSDSKYRTCPLLVKYVEAGWLGRKTGRGFYDYRGEKPVPTR